MIKLVQITFQQTSGIIRYPINTIHMIRILINYMNGINWIISLFQFILDIEKEIVVYAINMHQMGIHVVYHQISAHLSKYLIK